jgi:hypothetical protein
MKFVSSFLSARTDVVRKFLCFVLPFIMPLLLFSANALAVSLPPNAANPLKTQAEISFYAAGDPQPKHMYSNIVLVDIFPVQVIAFSFEAEMSIQPGQRFSIPLVLHNNGNVAAPYTLAVSKGALTDMPVLIRDINSNGRKDGDDFVVAPNRLGHLEYGGYDSLILTGMAPPENLEGRSYQVEIVATLHNTDIVATADIKLNISSAPQVQVFLEASRHNLDVGESTQVTADIINSGVQTLRMGKAVVIDGRPPEEVTLLRYRIPAGMRFVSDDSLQKDLKPSDTLLFATGEDADFHYRTQVAPEKVREIALAVGSALARRDRRSMTFTLELVDDSGSQIVSQAEGFDNASLLASPSNILTFDMARATAPDIVPHIVQRSSASGHASGDIKISVENIGASATAGSISMRGELPSKLRSSDIEGKNWQCTVRDTASGSSFECISQAALPVGATTPPVSIASQGDICGPDKKITVAVDVPNEASNLRGNNRAEALLLCSKGAVISGRAWIDASNDGIYQRGEELLSGWRAQLLRGGKVLKEAVTDQQGQYRIDAIMPEQGYSLRFLSPQGRIEAPPLDSRDRSGVLVVDAHRSFVDGALVYDERLVPREYPDQDLALIPTGIIFDAQTAKPIVNAKITLLGPEGFDPGLHLVGPESNVTTTTDAHGRYNFFLTPDAPAGVYRWQVDVAGYEEPRRDNTPLNMKESLAPTGPDEVRAVYKVFETTAIPSVPLLHGALQHEAVKARPAHSNGYFVMNRVQGARKVVNNHLGLDPLVAGGELSLQKSADRKTVELIDFFHYTLKISHRRATGFAGFVIDDSLPRGLRYVPGSARLMDGGGNEGRVLPDPIQSGAASMHDGSGSGVTPLHFDFSTTPLLPNSPLEIRYRVAVGATAAEGAKLTSYATAHAGTETAQAQAAIRIRGGVFSDDAFVLGKVFLDCNGDGEQNADEPGVPGVRIYLEDGRFADTDRHGKYSLYGIKPLTHVLKMDTATLPASARPQALSHRHAGRGDLRFLDLRNGELGRGDFALSCNAAVQAEVTYRRTQLADAGDELDSALKLRFDAEARAEDGRQTIQGDRASGWIGEGARRTVPAAATSPVSAFTATSAASTINAATDATGVAAAPSSSPSPSLDTLLRGDAALRIVGLSDGQILASDFTDVTVLGSDAADFVLTVNGEVVPQQQVGQRSALASRHAAAWSYIAVRLHSGKNIVAVQQQQGDRLQHRQIEVIVPGPAARMDIVVPAHLLADGKSAVALDIALFDRDGVPATAPSLVTLNNERVSWLTPDANPEARGLQVLVRDGHAAVLLKAPAEAGSIEVHAELGMLKRTVALPFVPALRPMVAAGIVEGMVTLNNGRIDTGGNTGFERELRSFARSSADGKQAMAGRIAFFLKGQVKGEYLLTASFDSDKDARERLFRDIEPDKYYPVYGDDSVRGFDAQSSSKLYLRIDKDRSYLVLGDFNTGQSSTMRQLTQYSRAVNGVAEHLEQGPLVANVFASHDNLRQQVITFAAANTRFYPGKLPPFYVEGSERVEIVTADRAQGGIGQRVRTLARFADYTIDELSGSLKVTEAVTRLDPETGGLNSYRITFEVEEGAAQSWLYGGDVTVSPTASTKLGVMAVNDDNPNQARRLRGVFGSWQAGPQTEINGELARTTLGEDITRAGNENNDGAPIGSGSGWRVGAKHNGERLQSELAVVGTSDAFSNLSAPVAGGRFEARAKNQYTIDERTRLKSEVLRTRDRLAGGSHYGNVLDAAAERDADGVAYTGVLVGVERDLGTGLKAELGMRAVRGEIDRSRSMQSGNGNEALDLLTVRTRVSSVVPGLTQATVYGEVEQDVRSRDKRALALGGDYALPGKGRLYARHELLSSLGSAYELEENARSYRTLIGIEGDYMEGGQAFSEYRGARPLTERGPETAYGTRNSWQINDRLNLRTSLERTRSLSGGAGNGRGGGQSDASSLSTTLEYRYSAQLKGTTGLDVRLSNADTSYLYTLGVGYRMNDSWTLLGKNALYLVRGKGGDKGEGKAEGGAGRDTLRTRQRIGLAYRQAQGTGLNALGYYEYRLARNDSRSSDDETAHIVSVHVNAQPARHWDVSGRYAGKVKTMDGVNGRSGVRGHLVSGRVTRDIGFRWDAGLAAALFADSLGQRKQAFGVEAGYLLKDDLWLSIGYNAVGFTDRDFAGMAETTQGVYFRMRYKFDENSF